VPESWRESKLWSIWDGSRFVEQSLTLEDARSRLGEHSILVPEEYLGPGLDADAAPAIAEVALADLVADRQARAESHLHFAETELVGKSPLWWTFRRVCAEWQEEGLVPGAVSCAVDRVDGHIWSTAETEAFWRNQGKS